MENSFKERNASYGRTICVLTKKYIVHEFGNGWAEINIATGLYILITASLGLWQDDKKGHIYFCDSLVRVVRVISLI